MAESLASIEIGGTSYPMVLESRCKTCVHPMRSALEQELAKGRGYSHLIAEFDLEGELTAQNLSDHIKNQHMPFAAPVVQQLVRHRAQEMRAVVAPLSARLATHLGFAQTVVERVQHRIDAGDVEPTVADGVAAARLLAAASAAAGGSDIAEWEAEALETLENVREIMDERQWQEFSRRMDCWSRQRAASR